MSKKSIYIHIPFCIKKCFYCDFYSVEDIPLQSDYVKADYINALANEIRLRSCKDSKPRTEIETLYFGGGTPSTLSLSLIEKTISTLNKNYKIDKACEITMEVNPGTIDKDYVSELKALGINRLNIGIQSFQDDKLNTLGRIHSTKQAKNAIEFSRNAGFKNLGIDLIYGIPNQDIESWIKDLTRALFFQPEHLSCYMLTFEKNTQFYNKLKQGLIKPVTKETLSSFFIKTSNFLTEKDYIHYEISNFSSSIETMSKHNSKYWDQSPYIGFGASAHSFDGETRSWNHSDIRKYITDLEEKKLPIAGKEALTKEQKKIEMIMLGLRTKDGVDYKLLDGCFNHCLDNHFNNSLIQLTRKKLCKIEKNNFSLTKKGMCYLDDIIQLFVDMI